MDCWLMALFHCSFMHPLAFFHLSNATSWSTCRSAWSPSAVNSQVERGFRAVHISGVELQHMGQQTMGHYPVHFHMNGDVDERGGYNPPTSVSDLSIHHSFSRCVTIHASNGLLVSLNIFYSYNDLMCLWGRVEIVRHFVKSACF